MTADESQIDRHIADLYRAAAGEVPWGQPLRGLVDLLQAWAVYLHGVRLSDGAVAFGYDVGGFPASAALEYVRRYHRIDPRTNLLLPNDAGNWINCHEHFDEDFVRRDRFYQDFLIPNGGRYVSGVKIYQDDEIVAFFGIHRGQGMQPLAASELALGQRFGHHLTNALGLWRRQRHLLQDALVGNALLGRLEHPVLLIDEQTQVHYRNAAAQRLLGEDDRLEMRGGMLACVGHGRAADLHDALRSLRLGGAASYGASGPAQSRAVVRSGKDDGRAALVLLLSALHPTETLGAFGPRSLAMVLVHDPAEQRAPDPFIIAECFDLTPAEAKVAVRIAAGDTPRQIASAHGVALSTVRSQISGVLAKVGVSRQAELVAALATVPKFSTVDAQARIGR